ncbi:MAG: 30S ribosome-binding factor RbfA [Desulfobulbaceae bacterium]|nr:30S ribosome-binding factor RbfA [Desulfobulbaceae bacterium]
MAVWDPKQTLDSIGVGEKNEQKRSSRVAEAIKNELSTLLISKVADPRLLGANISRVEVTDDLSLARIYFTVFGDKKEIRAADKGFQRAAGFMRSHIAKTLNLRFTPALEFRYDNIADKVAELDEIFQEIANERESNKDDS